MKSKIENVGIVGTGTMGIGIAQTLLTNGYDVTLYSRTKKSSASSQEKLISNFEWLESRDKITNQEKVKFLNNIRFKILEDEINNDLIIESIVEEMKAKKELFKHLDQKCHKDTIFVSNTSSLSLTEMETDVSRAITGLHFFNPAPVMKLVEITKSIKTNDLVIDQLLELTNTLNKTAVISEESPGFIVNRILIPMINEAIFVYAEGLGSAEDIDNAMKLGANHPMGPLELADYIGLDVCLSIMEVLYEEFSDSKYRAHPLLRKMVRANKLGRKTGDGFYKY